MATLELLMEGHSFAEISKECDGGGGAVMRAKRLKSFLPDCRERE